MKESVLLKIALICSLLGLLVLYFVSSGIEAKDYNPSQLNKDIGEDVKFAGIVSKITKAENVIFIEVNHQNTVTVVLFTKDNPQLDEGDNVEIDGEIQEYKGKEEIIAQKITVIK